LLVLAFKLSPLLNRFLPWLPWVNRLLRTSPTKPDTSPRRRCEFDYPSHVPVAHVLSPAADLRRLVVFLDISQLPPQKKGPCDFFSHGQHVLIPSDTDHDRNFYKPSKNFIFYASYFLPFSFLINKKVWRGTPNNTNKVPFFAFPFPSTALLRVDLSGPLPGPSKVPRTSCS